MARKQVTAQVLMIGMLCLLAFIPFIHKLPASKPAALQTGGLDPTSLRPPQPETRFNTPPENPASGPPQKERSWARVIDDRVRAAVRDSEEKAKGGIVQELSPGGGPNAHETIPPHRKLLDLWFSKEGGSARNRWGDFLFSGGQQELFECDRSSPLTDVCILKGDVRVNLTSGEVMLYARNSQTPRKEERIRPHPRKWNWGMLESSVTEFTLKSVDAGGSEPPPMPCLKRNTAPGVAFSVGGFCGGVFHDFNEVYLPLFETTHRTDGNVVMLVADLKGDWWWHDAPRRSFVGAMTRHPIKIIGRGFDTDNYVQGVECFDQLTVGLFQHTCMYDEFGGAENRLKATSAVRHFAPYVQKGLKIPDSDLAGGSRILVPEGGVPVIGVAQRLSSRKLKNFIHLLKAAKADGFKVVPIYFEHYSPEEAVKVMGSIDAFVAVHGAGLSNICLMRPGGVVLQIMPFGEGGDRNVVGAEYRNFARAMDAEYLEWRVSAPDSTIRDQYNVTDTVITSPETIWRTRGQDAMNIYHKQDVKMPEDVFRAYLHQIRRTLYLRARIAQEGRLLGPQVLDEVAH